MLQLYHETRNNKWILDWDKCISIMTKKESQKIKDDINEILYENRLDPRQKLCWGNYVDQTKPTFSNAYQAALSAGYTHYYSKTITTRPWFKDKVRRTHLLTKAEKVINKILDMETDKADILRVQSDVSKHITKTLGKDEGYTEKTEVSGSGSNIVFLPQELINKFGLGKEEPKVESPTDNDSTDR